MEERTQRLKRKISFCTSSNALICNNDSSVNSHVGTDFQCIRFMHVTSTRQASNRSCNNFAVDNNRELLSKFIPVEHTKNMFFSNSRRAKVTGKRSTRKKMNKFLAEFVKRNPTRCNNVSKFLLFHICIKLNMFRATHRPSSGA